MSATKDIYKYKTINVQAIRIIQIGLKQKEYANDRITFAHV